MKKSLLLIAFAALVLTACESPVAPPQPIPSIEEPEAITNDFTLIKACIGASKEEAVALLTQHGYREGKANTFNKTENSVPKEVQINAGTNGIIVNIELLDKGTDLDRSKELFIQWLKEVRASKAYSRMIRMNTTIEEMISSLTSSEDCSSSSFYGNDVFANQYSFVFYPKLDCNYMQIYNPRAGQPSNDFVESDLNESDLNKHILISKVDYQTFQYKGFYALNVSGKTNDGELIPIISEYQAPCDFGFIKLYYRDKTNLLMDGTIVWNGCGQLAFPEPFRAGLPVKEAIPFPGIEHFARLGEDGQYTETVNEWEMKHIWQSVSYQKEFQHYFGNSTKKVAVYLYAPSIGLFDPYEAYYLVFVEQ